ncbi:hypothetical protein AG1IA_06652 [Rhizoctonia solani AG-1 IA]|uniref:Uncharacterized protein n=1 Tax=Thanatephorus cucumeris (strain AG1-IA) TaxID=983506 RepID=L8WRF7_THACA|nr:hypothetical protein AG1IA_06652 [Rhizoctonia solani AG-1 IA]
MLKWLPDTHGLQFGDNSEAGSSGRVAHLSGFTLIAQEIKFGPGPVPEPNPNTYTSHNHPQLHKIYVPAPPSPFALAQPPAVAEPLLESQQVSGQTFEQLEGRHGRDGLHVWEFDGRERTGRRERRNRRRARSRCGAVCRLVVDHDLGLGFGLPHEPLVFSSCALELFDSLGPVDRLGLGTTDPFEHAAHALSHVSDRCAFTRPANLGVLFDGEVGACARSDGDSTRQRGRQQIS